MSSLTLFWMKVFSHHPDVAC